VARAYSDFDKALAVEIVHRNGGVLSSDALAEIRAALSAPDLKQQTVRYWIKNFSPSTATGETPKSTAPNQSASQNDQSALIQKNDDVVTSVRQRFSEALDVKLERAAHMLVDHAVTPRNMQGLDSQKAMTAAAIAIDKMRLLRNLPTEIVEILPVVMTELERAGVDPVQAFQALLNKARAKANANR
jgi:hypothetical protein